MARSCSWLLAFAASVAACGNSGSDSESGLFRGALESPPALDETPPGATFTNPIADPADTPSVAYWEGSYYLVGSAPDHPEEGIFVRSSPTLAGLGAAEKQRIWSAGQDGTPSHNIWAPEIWHLDGKWYVYFTAGDDTSILFREQAIYALEADAPTGPYRLKGKMRPDGEWSIDGSVLELPDGARYFLWCGQEPGSIDSHLYIASLANPWTISSDRVRIASPSLPWELRSTGSGINEAPVALVRNEKVHVVFSANHDFYDRYCLGRLTADIGSDLLEPASWTKHPECIFEGVPEESLIGPGHNFFVRSPDDFQTWNVHHAKREMETWERQVHVQQIGWTEDDLPILGRPVSRGTELAAPSGEPGAQSRRLEAEYQILRGVAPELDAAASSGQSVHLGGAESESIRFEVPSSANAIESLLIRYRGTNETSVVLTSGDDRVELALPATGDSFGVSGVRIEARTEPFDFSLRTNGAVHVDCVELR